jgi:hypothetical protein
MAIRNDLLFQAGTFYHAGMARKGYPEPTRGVPAHIARDSVGS